MIALDITEVARRTGVPASTLRFYEEKRLIASIGRRGLRRQFDRRVLERLALIALIRTFDIAGGPRRVAADIVHEACHLVGAPSDPFRDAHLYPIHQAAGLPR
jgi:hypothetical protein